MESRIFRSDQKRIKQVLVNILSNSYKFTERGTIRLRVRLVYNENESFLQFSIKDTGVGISKNDMTKLFKMFSMTSKSQKQLSQYGSGVGLSISKKIVESLGGQISASSEEGYWSEFSFTIKNMVDSMNYEESKVIINYWEDTKFS